MIFKWFKIYLSDLCCLFLKSFPIFWSHIRLNVSYGTAHKPGIKTQWLSILRTGTRNVDKCFSRPWTVYEIPSKVKHGIGGTSTRLGDILFSTHRNVSSPYCLKKNDDNNKGIIHYYSISGTCVQANTHIHIHKWSI